MEQDRRRSKRGDIFLVVEFKLFKATAGHATGITKDLSSEGFSLEAQGFEFESGQIMEFRLRSLQNDLTVAALGEIAWIKNSWYKFSAGIKFLDLDEATKAKIQELMTFVRRPYKPFSGSETPEIEATPEKKGLPEPNDSKEKITDDLMPDVSGVEADDVTEESGPDLESAGQNEDEIKKEDICLEPPGQDGPSATEIQVPPADEPAGDVEEVKGEKETEEDDELSGTKPDQESVLQSEEPGDKGLGPDMDQESRDDIDTGDTESDDAEADDAEADDAEADDAEAIERGEKKGSRRYAPVAMIFAAIFVAALLVTLRYYNVSLESLNSVFTGLTSVEDVETGQPLPDVDDVQLGGQAFNEPLDSEAVQPDKEGSVLFAEEEQLAGTTPAKIEKIPEPGPGDTEIRRVKPVIDIEKASSGEVIAKIEGPLKSDSAAEIKKPRKTKPVALSDKTPKSGKEVKGKAVAETVSAPKKAKSPGTGKGIKLRKRAKAKVKKIPADTGVKGKAVAETGAAPKKAKSSETGKRIKPLKRSQSETVAKSRKSLETKPPVTSRQVKSPKRAIAAKKVPKTVPAQGSPETLEAKPEQVTEKKKNKLSLKTEKLLQAQKSESVEKEVDVLLSEPDIEIAESSPTGLIENTDKPSNTELAGEKAEPAKTGTIAGTQKVPKLALFLRRNKPRSIKKESSDKVESAKRKWKKVGKARNGTLLFLDSASITYPSVNIVQLFMKAVVNEKEFMDLVKIDCLGNKLRIIKEGTEKNPILSPYSTEWRDIIPESMPLFDAACSSITKSSK